MPRPLLAAALLTAALLSAPGCSPQGSQASPLSPSARPLASHYAAQRRVLALPLQPTESSKPAAVFHTNIFEAALANTSFRKVLTTTQHAQLVVMSLAPGESIGQETHTTLDQILVFVSGTGEYHIGKSSGPIAAGELFVVPAHTPHNFVNTGKVPLKLYTLYAPPAHRPGTVHHTKKEAEKEHY